MSKDFQQRCRDLMIELGLTAIDDSISVTTLTGGVASDIARIETDKGDFCVKFALPKLRVAADWYAPVERNFAEFSYLKNLSEIAPEASLTLYGHSASENGFAMAYLAGDNTYLWKPALFDGRGRCDEAKAVGSILGKVHHASSQPDFDKSAFHNQDDFYAIRIEPYLVHTAKKHPLIATQLHQMAEHLGSADSVLVHGDVSPKNIMFHNGQPFLLDAECATMGDGCFDVAFCLNHLILKAVFVTTSSSNYLSYCLDFWQSYQPFITWESQADFERRLCQLLPMLMLARIDGKSPVEYFNHDHHDFVRQLALPLISEPATDLSELLTRLRPIIA